MDIDQLKTFDRIARDLSFTQAAARLNVTQATVSMRIRVLEAHLGATLFTRGRKIALTDEGITFLPYARRVLASAQDGQEALKRVERGRVVIGSLRSIITPLFTDPLLNFQDAHPNIDVVIHEGRHEQIYAMLHERIVALGVVCWPNLSGLEVDVVPLMVMREPVPLVMAPELANKLSAKPDIEEILEIAPRIISLRWWQVEPDHATALVRRAKTSVELPTGPARRLAIKGAGVGFFVKSAVASALQSGELVEVRPSNYPPLHRDIALVSLPGTLQERELLASFAQKLAVECANMGAILEDNMARELGTG